MGVGRSLVVYVVEMEKLVSRGGKGCAAPLKGQRLYLSIE